MRTTDRWMSLPGGFDKLHCNPDHGVTSFEPTYGLPELQPLLPAADKYVQSADFLSYSMRARRRKPYTILHFFEDDYRFESVWTHLSQGLRALQSFTWVCSPDFSCYQEWPFAVNLWNIYRSRWLGAYWQAHGLAVIPTVTWAGGASIEYCFRGLPKNNIVAVATPDIRSVEVEMRFLAGFQTMLWSIQPRGILVYGKLPIPASEVQLRSTGVEWIREIQPFRPHMALTKS